MLALFFDFSDNCLQLRGLSVGVWDGRSSVLRLWNQQPVTSRRSTGLTSIDSFVCLSLGEFIKKRWTAENFSRLLASFQGAPAAMLNIIRFYEHIQLSCLWMSWTKWCISCFWLKPFRNFRSAGGSSRVRPSTVGFAWVPALWCWLICLCSGVCFWTMDRTWRSSKHIIGLSGYFWVQQIT